MSVVDDSRWLSQLSQAHISNVFQANETGLDDDEHTVKAFLQL